MSTSMPIDVQAAIVRSIPGLENADMIRPGYAIEYDMVQPTELHPWLETKKIPNLFLAGQINGTTGYEEAACQGIMAGINAGLQVRGGEPLVVERTRGYTGILVDDLAEWINEKLASSGLQPLGGAGGVTSLFAREEARRVETDFKYEGYLVQQEKQIERLKRAESRRIPDWFDYKRVSGLSREVVEKLTKVRPLTLGQASRIPGITPAAVSLVNVYIEIFQRRSAEQPSA